MTKYVPKGSVVDATQVTDSNLEKLAEEHGGVVHTSVRADGKRFVIFEGPNGSSRADVGGYVVVDPNGYVTGYRTAGEFEDTYQRP